jgi:hypothetical protein
MAPGYDVNMYSMVINCVCVMVGVMLGVVVIVGVTVGVPNGVCVGVRDNVGVCVGVNDRVGVGVAAHAPRATSGGGQSPSSCTHPKFGTTYGVLEGFEYLRLPL